MLCANLWFVFEVLKMLGAVNDALMLLAGWLGKARSEGKREPDNTDPVTAPIQQPTATERRGRSVLIIAALSALVWAVVIAIAMAVWPAL